MSEPLDSTLSQEAQTSSFKLKTVIIWGAILLFGIIAKLLHWPGGAVLVIVSSAIFTAYNIVYLIRLKGKNLLNTVLAIAGITWFIVLLAGALFNNGYPYNLTGVIVFTIVLIIAFVVFELIARHRSRK